MLGNVAEILNFLDMFFVTGEEVNKFELGQEGNNVRLVNA